MVYPHNYGRFGFYTDRLHRVFIEIDSLAASIMEIFSFFNCLPKRTCNRIFTYQGYFYFIVFLSGLYGTFDYLWGA